MLVAQLSQDSRKAEGRTEKVGAGDADRAVGLGSFDDKMRCRLSSDAAIRHLSSPREAQA